MSQIPSLPCPPSLAAQGFRLAAEAAEDEAFLRQLFACQRWADLALLPWDDTQKAAFLDSQFDLQRRHYTTRFPAAQGWVLWAPEGGAGRLLIAEDGDNLRLVDILLASALRGQGIGEALLLALQSYAQDLRLGLALQVDKFNPAARLYQRLSFQVNGESDLAWSMAWHA